MNKKLAKVYYADLWGLRERKYQNLLKSDIQTTKWKKLKPLPPYYFFVPKDFALQPEYEKFWKVTDIFKEFKTGIATHRDHFIIGFTKDEIVQRLRIFTGSLSDDFVMQSLKLKDTRDWKFKEARQKSKKEELENKICLYAYRAFDTRYICYSPVLLEFDRFVLMRHILKGNNISLVTSKILSSLPFNHVFISVYIGDNSFISNRTKEKNYFFPLYLYPDKSKAQLFERKEYESERISNFTPAFLQAIKESFGKEPAPEEMFSYIYAILYSPTYRKRYEEFLKIDFPRIPLPSNYEHFQKLSKLGQELIDLHLLKHPALSSIEISFPRGGSNKVEKVRYEEKAKKLLINKDQYFENVSKDIWEYRIGAYQVMEKYLKDRKGRKLSLDEINHYLKIAKAIHLTMEIQKKIDKIK